MDKITDDLLTEILIRLPHCRQAVRCAAVCKSWSSLIRTTQFVQSFTDRHNGLDDSDISVGTMAFVSQKTFGTYKDVAIVGETRANRNENYLSFLPGDNLTIRAYCNDLLLVSRYNESDGSEFSFCICNPMTGKYWCGIPEPPLRKGDFIINYALGCRENRGRHSYHVTVLTKDFPCTDPLDREIWAMDFSSEIGQWSSPVKLQLPPQLHFWNIFCPSLVSCGNGLVYCSAGKSVFGYDPLVTTSRKCQNIPWPTEVGDYPNLKSVRLGAYRGRLRAAYITDDTVLRVWELVRSTDRHSRWSLVRNVALEVAGKRITISALHPGNSAVVFLENHAGLVFRYDISGQPAQIVSCCPIKVYPLCSTWPTPVPLLPSNTIYCSSRFLF